jgi:hypothetical protein
MNKTCKLDQPYVHQCHGLPESSKADLRLTIACNGELDDWYSRHRSLTLVPVDAGC